MDPSSFSASKFEFVEEYEEEEEEEREQIIPQIKTGKIQVMNMSYCLS